MVKNLKILNSSFINKKLCALSLVGIVTLSTLTSCSSVTDINRIDNIYIEPNLCEGKVFEVGEHVISVTRNDVFNNNEVHDIYEGYEIIHVDTHINLLGIKQTTIVYKNNTMVECITNIKDKDGNVLYNKFGTPIYLEKQPIKILK